MMFDSWLNKHLEEDFKLPSCKRTENDVELFEKQNNVTLKVEDVPASVVVVIPEAAGRWTLWPPNRPFGWAKRCDYLLVGNLSGQYFAVFIELKTTYSDGDGKWQLLWTQPLFHYMLSMFNIACQTELCVSDFIIKHWKFCDSISPNPLEETVLADDHSATFLKDPVTLPEDEESYFSDCFRGLTIHNRVTIPIQLKDLVEI